VGPAVGDVATINGMRYTWRRSSKKASRLNDDDQLANGALILHLSFQRNWIYAQVIKDSQLTRRRYRHDQEVSTRELTPGAERASTGMQRP